MLARHFTTTDMTPEEIHNIGLSEVARIRGEMEEVIEEVGFDGDINAFNDFLRTDPQFYYETAEELLEGYQAVSKRLDPELVKLFGKLPRMPYGVRPIAARARPGYNNRFLYAACPRWKPSRLVLREPLQTRGSTEV